MLSEEGCRMLLTIARETAAAAAAGRQPPDFNESAPELQERQGAFVTLKTHGRLRGCMGQFVSDEPLWKTVAECAALSASRDPRFAGSRLRLFEMNDLRIEISVLSPLRRIQNPLDIELGVHGIYVRRGMRGGCFLPQVATETGWTKEEFLSNCCAGKAGLAPDAWKDPQTEVLVFTAQIIEEEPH